MRGSYDQIVAAAKELDLLEALEALASTVDVRAAFTEMRALVKAARVKKALAVHPDRGGSAEAMAIANAAADVLTASIDEALASMDRPRPVVAFAFRRTYIRVHSHYSTTATSDGGGYIWLEI